MKFADTPENIDEQSLDDRLDEALDESFPASDPPAVHPHYAGRSNGSSANPSGLKGTAMTRIELEGGAVSIDAALLTEELGMTPDLVMTQIQEGKITCLCEQVRDDDVGHLKLTFFHGDRGVRFIVDEQGNILERRTAIFQGRVH